MREEAPSTERAAQQEVKQTDGETDKGVCVSLNYVIQTRRGSIGKNTLPTDDLFEKNMI